MRAESGQISDLSEDAELWRIFCKGEKCSGQEKQDGGRKDELFCLPISVDIIFDKEGEDNACKI